MSALSNLNAPGPFADFAVGYDPVTGRLILQAEEQPAGTLIADTYAWDGTSWTQLSPTTEPAPESGGSMAVDPVSGKLMYMGGAAATDALEGTWLWDGSSWARVANNPDQGDEPGLAVDAATGQLLAECGDPVTSSGGPSPPSWTMGGFYVWTGSGWVGVPSNAGTSGQDPVSDLANMPAMAYDPISHQVIAFGGGQQAPLDDTLAYDGADWTVLVPNDWGSPASGPQGLAWAATDESAGQIVLLTLGSSSDGPAYMTWTWNGSAWVEQSTAAEPQAADYGSIGLVWAPAIGRVVLVTIPEDAGGVQLWVWTGDTTGWVQVGS